MKRKVYQIDAFTKLRFTGNPAGVVTNADGMSDHQMQGLARELNNSETAFIFSASASDHDFHIRYFTPTTEVPVCGHATVASGYALSLENRLSSISTRIRTGAGILSISLYQSDDHPKVEMVQGQVVLEPPFADEIKQRIIGALGLESNDVDVRCPIGVASTGHSKIMIGIHSKSRLNALEPNLDALKVISREVQCDGYYVFTFDSTEDDVLICGRMFAPAIGINEDPVTGNANGPLGAYLVANKLVAYSESEFRFTAMQGETMGRKGYVDVKVAIDGEGAPTQVSIFGHAVKVFDTDIEI
ncbi:MAG: PhzF family isomerase [Undibacterium sp.]|nr:PhzF family isomerase [Undibacterium sp.]